MTRFVLSATAAWLTLPLLLSAQPTAEKDDPPRLLIRLRLYDYSEPSRYWGYGPRLSPLSGLADLQRAKGDYWKTIQEAAQAREKVRQERLRTDRQRLEHLAWKRDFQIEQWEKEEKRARAKALRTSQQEDTPLPLVLDGSALNILTTHLGALSIPPGTSSTKIPNARQVLAHINFTGTSGGHVGLLRQERVLWPVLLLEDEFADRRGRVEELLKDGRSLAAKGEPAARVLKELLGQIDGLEKRVIALSQSTDYNPLNSPGQQIASYRFLKDLQRTANVLADPAEAKTLLAQALQVDDVAGLVQHLRSNGLRFGPSTADNRQYYLILHKAMAEESRRQSPSAP